MKKIGILALILGLLGALLILGMDTTVEASRGSRVHNLGLMSMQQNLLLVSIALAFIGVVILISNNRKTKSSEPPTIPDTSKTDRTHRTCPFCAERIKAQAIVCRYCGHEITPLETALKLNEAPLASSKNPTATQKTSNYLTSIESQINNVCLWLRENVVAKSDGNIAQRVFHSISERINFVAYCLIALGLFEFIWYAFFADYSYVKEIGAPAWYASLHKFYRLEERSLIIFSGLIIYFRNSIVKPGVLRTSDSLEENRVEANFSNISLSLLGKTIDFALLQSVLILIIIVLHTDNQLELSYIYTVVAVAIGFLLSNSKQKWFGIITMLIGIGYILCRHFVFSEFSYAGENLDQLFFHAPSILNIWPFFWIFTISIAVPHFQLLKIGNLRYGSLRGDVNRRILNHQVFLPFGSAFVAYILWQGISIAILILYSMLHRIF